MHQRAALTPKKAMITSPTSKLRDVAETLAKHLDLPAVSVSPAQARDYVGFLGGFWGFDGPASAQLTRELLGWRPTRPGLLADLDEGHYFA